MKRLSLTNSDLEHIYRGEGSVEDLVLIRILADYAGPEDWYIVEFEFGHRSHDTVHVGRAFYKLGGSYGLSWESELLGERHHMSIDSAYEGDSL